MHVSAWLDTVDDADLAISALTVREVRKGIVKLAVKKPELAAQIEARVRDVFEAGIAFFRSRLKLPRFGAILSVGATSTSRTRDWSRPPEFMG